MTGSYSCCPQVAGAGFFMLAVVAVPLLGAQQATSTVSSAKARPIASALAFDGVTVIDVTDGRLLPKQTVVVVGNRIQAVGPADQVQVPRGAQVVDARGKYLIPGLWDMHAHVETFVHDYYPQFIAHGVTGLRELGQRFPGGADSFRVWQREIAAGSRVGPRGFGPSVDLTAGMGVDFKITTPEDARRIIDSLKTAGITFLKMHATGTKDPNVYYAMVRAARRAGLPFVGHAPIAETISEVEMADSGQRSIEHVEDGHKRCWPALYAADSAAAAKWCGLAAKAFIRNGTWLVPTLVVAGTRNCRACEGSGQLVTRMHRLGVRRFLAGADAYPSNIVEIEYGFSLLQEIMLLAEAGLTPLEALQAATLHPAQYFEADSFGTIAPGKLADLVLLDANPLASIYNVQHIQAVVANGRYFDRAALDALDPNGTKYAQAYAAAIAKYGRTPRGAWIRARLPRVKDEKEATRRGVPGLRGLWVASVEPQSNTAASGLQVGDLIVSIAGQPALEYRIYPHGSLLDPGDTLSVDVVRQGGQPQTLHLKLDAWWGL